MRSLLAVCLLLVGSLANAQAPVQVPIPTAHEILIHDSQPVLISIRYVSRMANQAPQVAVQTPVPDPVPDRPACFLLEILQGRGGGGGLLGGDRGGGLFSQLLSRRSRVSVDISSGGACPSCGN